MRSVLRRGGSLLCVLMLMVSAAACSSRTSGTPSSVIVDKHSAPAIAYDLALYMCNPVARSIEPGCHDRLTTVDDMTALTTAFDNDRDVAQYVLVPEDASAKLAVQAEPALRGQLTPGTLPASYMVKAASGVGLDSLIAKYAAFAGVGNVHRCALQVQCRVAALRGVGVLR